MSKRKKNTSIKNILVQRETNIVINNVFIGNDYEIHFSNDHIVVKDIQNRRYLRLTGNLMKYIEENIESNDLYLFLNSIFSSKSYSHMRKSLCVECATNHSMEKATRFIPKRFFNLAVMTIVIVLGIIAGLITTFRESGDETHPLIIYICWVILNILVHEIGHAIICIGYGRSVYSFGLKLNFFIPMVYVDTSDICMSHLKGKVATSLGGVYFNSILCIFTAITYFLSNCLVFSYCSSISLFFILSNLLPFLKLDGYYVVSDLLGEINLNRASNNIIKKLIIDKHKFSKHDYILIVYFIFKNIFYIIILCVIVYECFLFINSIFTC